MPVAIVTGAGGLVGSECAAFLCESGFDVVGVENDLRASFFGPSASTTPQVRRLSAAYDGFRNVELDIRDTDGIDRLFQRHRRDLELVVHAAAQPSHDWAASAPHVDFAVNATGTLNLLEATRTHQPAATFIFTSTNKVYGDRPNNLPLVEEATRLELPADHPAYLGIDTSMPIDRSLHSIFGASKAAADLLVQEYGRYFDLPTVAFRCGCLTGPNHAGARLHGFLSYLVQCTATGTPYVVHGYGGLQVRDNLHSADLVRAFAAFHENPRPGAVYNLGGGRASNCSMLEAIAICERIAGRELRWTLDDAPRVGDHRWWISDVRPFQADYPGWRVERGVEAIVQEIYDANIEAWVVAVA